MNELIHDISYANMRDMLDDCIIDVQERSDNMGVPRISSGFQPLDNLIGGFENGRVYVVGGRPCMGREDFVLSIIIDIIVESKQPVLLFSTNHLKSDYIHRLLAIHCEIPSQHLYQGSLDSNEWKRVDERVLPFAGAPLYIHDCLDLPLNELIETARNCIREREIKIIFIDCLQMIDFAKEDDNPSKRIAKIMLSLKQLACLSDVPIVVGSMLSRGIERRQGLEGKQPQLIDLANSSYIEELADVIMMVHRPEYCHIYRDANGRDLRGQIEIIVKKNALKPLGSFILDYHQETGIIRLKKNTGKSVSGSGNLKDLSDDRSFKSMTEVSTYEDELPF
ncbi:MAG: DnaB-like helicase C-terminal domain-containing protein [Prevotella sp.]|nr:DnaB-like helicase C-terminal domain-containing protein [Prevotella sp.]